MTEEQKAAALAAWLDGPAGAPLPEGLDEDVLSAVLTLRADRAPGPTLTVDAILEGVREGPFAATPARDADHGADVIAFPVPETRAPTVARARRPWWMGAGLGVALAAAAAAVVVLPQYGREQGAGVDPLAQDLARREDVAIERSAAPVVAEAEGTPSAAAPTVAPPSEGALPDGRSAPAPSAAARSRADALGELGGVVSSGGLVGGGAVGGGAVGEGVRGLGAGMAAPGGYGSGATGTGSGPWRPSESAYPAPEANRAPDPPVGSTPAAGSLEEAPARVYAQEGRAVPALDEDVPVDLAAAPPPPAAPAAKAEAASVERKKARASAPATAAKESAAAPAVASAGEEPDRGPTDGELRQAALPRGYVATWWQSSPEVAVVYGRAEATPDARAAAELYLTLAGDSRTLVAQDAAWRAAKRLAGVDPARALAIAEAGLARGGAGTPFRANLVVLKGDLLLAAGRREEALATWRAR